MKSTDVRARPANGLSWLALAIVLVVAAILRFHGLGYRSLWLDETVSWHQASQPLWAMLKATAGDNHPPLHNTILYVAIRALGDSEAAMRLPSALWGIGAVAAIFWVGSLVEGRLAGLLAAILLCLSGFHLYYSQEARPYALFALTATLAAGAALRALASDRRGWHWASASASLALLYSHAYGLLLWPALLAAAIAGTAFFGDPPREVLRRWLLRQVVAGALFLPWAAILALRYNHILVGGFWIRKPDEPYLLAIAAQLSGGGYLALALAAGAVASLSLRPAGEAAPDSRASHLALHRLMLCAWAFAPLLLALAASLVSTPILFDKYLIGSLPGWLLLAATGFCRLLRLSRRPALAAALTLAVAAGAAAGYRFYVPTQHEDNRAAVRLYAAQAAAADCVFLFHGFFVFPLRYYLHELPACVHSVDAPRDVTPWTAPAAKHAWLFLGHIAESERQAVMDNLAAHGWKAETMSRGGGLELLLAQPVK